MATKKIKTQKVGNSERMVICGNPVTDLRRTSSALFAGVNNFAKRPHKSVRDYDRKRAKTIHLDC